MALPSAITVGSIVIVVTAGVGLAAVAAQPDARPSTHAAGHPGASSGDPDHPRATPGDGSQPRSHQKHHRQAHDAVPKVLVELYNNTGVTGVASRQAKVLQGAGWNVAATDNWYGVIPDDTVYYPAKLEGDAKQLAKVLGVDRLRPAVSPMRFDRLTVIFTQPA